MAISRSREVCTALCHALTSFCQTFEYGCAGAGVLSEGGLGSSCNPLGQPGEVAAHACSSAAQVTQAALQILLCRSVALAGRLEVRERISESFLKASHALHGLTGVGQLGRGLLMTQLLNLQAIALVLGPPSAAGTDGQRHSSGGKVCIDAGNHPCAPMQAACRACWRVQTPRQTLLPGVLQS